MFGDHRKQLIKKNVCVKISHLLWTQIKGKQKSIRNKKEMKQMLIAYVMWHTGIFSSLNNQFSDSSQNEYKILSSSSFVLPGICSGCHVKSNSHTNQ